MSALESILRAVRLRTRVHRYALRVLDDIGHAPLMDPAVSLGPQTAVAGLDPIRVLVFGGGLAVGYGVRSRAQAFDGPLTRLLAERTGRGVTLENRAVQHVAVADAVESLGLTGAHTFHVTIWCPSFAEGLEHLELRGWRNDLHQMIRDLRQERPVPLVLTHMPSPLGLHPAAVIARPWVARLNALIDQVAAEYTDVVSCTVEPFTAREVGQPVTDAAYFAAVAERIAPAAMAALRLSPVSAVPVRPGAGDPLSRTS